MKVRRYHIVITDKGFKFLDIVRTPDNLKDADAKAYGYLGNYQMWGFLVYIIEADSPEHAIARLQLVLAEEALATDEGSGTSWVPMNAEDYIRLTTKYDWMEN